MVLLHRPGMGDHDKVVPLYCYVAARHRFARGTACVERVPYVVHRVGKRCFWRRPRKSLSEDACMNLSVKNPDLWDESQRPYGVWWRDAISTGYGLVKVPGFSLRDKVETLLYWPRLAAGKVRCGSKVSRKGLPTAQWTKLLKGLTTQRSGSQRAPAAGRLKLASWTRVDVDGDGKAELFAVVWVLPRAGANTEEVMARYTTSSVLLLLRGGSGLPPVRLTELSGVAGIEALFDLNGDGLPELLLHGCAGRSECSYTVVVPRRGGRVWEAL